SLAPETKDALAHLAEPVHIQVFVTPSCPYCPKAVRMAHMMAMESDKVTADMVMANEFPQLSNKYNVMAVPKVVINEDTSFEGAIPEDDYVSFVAQATTK
ncbi:MAG TPA: glutaredoxin, partial [Candidatus Acetothermia bacterium]|nr:glutaredoxin [Candidatus Acetothermia bacterium]